MKSLIIQNGIINCIEVESKDNFLKSWSGMYEDVILYALLGGRENGFYIDIGANDPVLFSNTKLFYDLGWSGINVEPNFDLLELFIKHRARDLNLNYAVTDEIGTAVTFYKIDSIDIKGKNRQATIIPEIMEYRLRTSIPEEVLEFWSPNLIKKEKKNYAKLKEIGKRCVKNEYKVPTITLEKIFEISRNREIDFIDVDVEGAEYLVLKGANFSTYRPKIIMIEDSRKMLNKNNEDPFHIIEKSNYTLLCTDNIGLNKYYVRNESLDSIKNNLLSFNIPFVQQTENLSSDPLYGEYIHYIKEIEKSIINI